MRSTVYMNHYPHFRSPTGREAVTADLSASVAELGGPFTANGRAVDMTFQTLGFDRMNPPHPSNMLIIGSQESIKQRLPELRLNIGRIAQTANEAAEQSGNYRDAYLPNRMDIIAQSVVPAAIKNGEFIESVGMILSEFGEGCNDDGCSVDYGKRVGWYIDIGDKQAAFGKIPEETRQLLNIPVLQLETPPSKASFDTLTLRSLAYHWAIDHAKALKANGLTPALSDEYEQDCSNNVEAIQRMKAYVYEQKGRPVEQLHFPNDVIRQLVATERNAMVAEQERKAWLERVYPVPKMNTGEATT